MCSYSVIINDRDVKQSKTTVPDSVSSTQARRIQNPTWTKNAANDNILDKCLKLTATFPIKNLTSYDIFLTAGAHSFAILLLISSASVVGVSLRSNPASAPKGWTFITNPCTNTHHPFQKQPQPNSNKPSIRFSKYYYPFS